MHNLQKEIRFENFADLQSRLVMLPYNDTDGTGAAVVSYSPKAVDVTGFVLTRIQGVHAKHDNDEEWLIHLEFNEVLSLLRDAPKPIILTVTQMPEHPSLDSTISRSVPMAQSEELSSDDDDHHSSNIVTANTVASEAERISTTTATTIETKDGTAEAKLKNRFINWGNKFGKATHKATHKLANVANAAVNATADVVHDRISGNNTPVKKVATPLRPVPKPLSAVPSSKTVAPKDLMSQMNAVGPALILSKPPLVETSTADTAVMEEMAPPKDNKANLPLFGIFLQTAKDGYISLDESRTDVTINNSSLLCVRYSSVQSRSMRDHKFQWFRSSYPIDHVRNGHATDWTILSGATRAMYQPSVTDCGYQLKCIITVGDSTDQDDEKSSTFECILIQKIEIDPVIFASAQRYLEVESATFDSLLGCGKAEGKILRINIERGPCKLGKHITSILHDQKVASNLYIYQVSGNKDEPLHNVDVPIYHATAEADASRPNIFFLILPEYMKESPSALEALCTQFRLELYAEDRVTRETFLTTLGMANFNQDSVSTASTLYPVVNDPIVESIETIRTCDPVPMEFMAKPIVESVLIDQNVADPSVAEEIVYKNEVPVTADNKTDHVNNLNNIGNDEAMGTYKSECKPVYNDLEPRKVDLLGDVQETSNPSSSLNDLIDLLGRGAIEENESIKADSEPILVNYPIEPPIDVESVIPCDVSSRVDDLSGNDDSTELLDQSNGEKNHLESGSAQNFKEAETPLQDSLDEHFSTEEIATSDISISAVTQRAEGNFTFEVGFMKNELDEANRFITDLQRRLNESQHLLQLKDDELSIVKKEALEEARKYNEAQQALQASEQRISAMDEDTVEMRKDFLSRISLLEKEVQGQHSPGLEYDEALRSWQNEKSVLTSVIEDKEEKLAGLLSQVAELETIMKERDSLRIELSSVSIQATTATKSLAETQQMLSQAQANYDEVKAQLDDLTVKYDEVFSKLLYLEADKDGLVKEIPSIQSDGRKVSDIEHSAQKKSDSVSLKVATTLLSEEVISDSLEDEINTDETKNTNTIPRLDEYHRALEQRVELEKRVNELTEYVSAKESQLDSMKDVNRQLTEELQNVARSRRMPVKPLFDKESRSNSDSESKLTKAQNPSEALSKALEERDSTRNELNTVKALAVKYQIELANAEDQLSKYHASCEKLQQEVDSLTKQLHEGSLRSISNEQAIDHLQNKYDLLVQTQGTLTESQAICLKFQQQAYDLTQQLQEEKTKLLMSEKEVEKLRYQYRSLENERNTLGTKLQSLTRDMTRVLRDGMVVEDIERMLNDYTSINAELATVKAQRKTLSEEVASLTQKLAVTAASSGPTSKIATVDPLRNALLQKFELERVVKELTEYVNAKEMQIETLKKINRALTQELSAVRTK